MPSTYDNNTNHKNPTPVDEAEAHDGTCFSCPYQYHFFLFFLFLFFFFFFFSFWQQRHGVESEV